MSNVMKMDQLKKSKKGYSVTKNGVYFKDEEENILICSELRVEALCSQGNQSWGRLLVWFDPRGHKHEWAMPMRLLNSDGSELRSVLLDGGLYIASGKNARNLLNNYISISKPKRMIECVSRSEHDAQHFEHVTLNYKD